MPNEDTKFSELPVGTLASDSIFATSENDGNGGLISTGVSAADVGNFTIDNLQYPLKLDTENKKVAGAINELHSSVGADAYDDTATYNTGDVVIYNGALYTCKTAITTAEAWDVSHWDDTTLQPKTDNTLATTDKTVVGAINELKSGKADASTTYTKTEVDTALSGKADKSTTPIIALRGWGKSCTINYGERRFFHLIIGNYDYLYEIHIQIISGSMNIVSNLNGISSLHQHKSSGYTIDSLLTFTFDTNAQTLTVSSTLDMNIRIEI